MRVLGPIMLVFVIFQSIRLCAGGAVLKARMISFHNSIGKDIRHDCCDWPCFNDCDHFFEFNFDHYEKTTGVFEDRDVIYFSNNMRGISNPIVMRFNQWKGSVQMEVKVMDDDDGFSRYDVVDYIYYTYKGTPGPTSGSPNIQRYDLSGSRSNRGVPPTTLRVTFELYCEPHFYGTACDVECVPRDDNRGHYKCDPDTGDVVCLKGWEGVACTVRTDPCHQHNCQNGSTCRECGNSYTCICQEGFSGRFCETDIDECSSGPCYNGATCRDLPGRFVCDCPRSFTGPLCQHDICAIKDPCQNGGSCYDDGKCFCPPGWEGVACTIRTDDCHQNDCENGATCRDGDNSYKCICPEGFSGRFCETDIDECSSDPCYNGATCRDLPGRFVCECPPSFTGPLCQHDICVVKDPCQNGGSCYDDGKCFCPSSWEGVACSVRTDNCQQHDCQNGATCRDYDNSYKCICPEGFSGRFCETNIDECSSNPCHYGATCRDLPGGFVCECTRNFTGPFCQHDICVVKNPCQNGGSCYDEGKCFCPPAYTGTNCTENICDVITCGNGGTCVDGACICPPGLLGTHCQVDACVKNTKPQDLNVLPIAVGVAACVLLLLFTLLVVLLVRKWRSLNRRRRERGQAETRAGSPTNQCKNQTNSHLLDNRNGDGNYPGPPPGDQKGTGQDPEGQSMVLPPRYDSLFGGGGDP